MTIAYDYYIGMNAALTDIGRLFFSSVIIISNTKDLFSYLLFITNTSIY